jgi:cytosine/adenosine deaminase-related metal-dependent hydrolase
LYLEIQDRRKGGMIDKHIHLCRARTAEDRYWEHTKHSVREVMEWTLDLKRRAIGKVHLGDAYKDEELYERMKGVLTDKIAAGETEVWAVTDTTPDIGLVAFDTALKLRRELSGQVNLKVGAYPPFGIKRLGSDRHELMREAARRAHFIVVLPESDTGEDHPIGFDGHLKCMFEIAHENHLPIQCHLGQANDPRQHDTEAFVEAVRWLGSPQVEGATGPTVWAVHIISPSAYDDERFNRLVGNLVKYNIGVIVCPYAALSMRQLRPIATPTHNSIARVRELLVAGVPLALGVDNAGDIFVPLPRRVDLGRELEVAPNAVRFYDEEIWDKIARGEPLNDVDIELARRSLAEDDHVFQNLRT